MKKTGYILLSVVALSLASCERMKFFPDKPIAVERSLLIAHRGGGDYDEGNGLASCMYGLQVADGIECDIQRSNDNNIWLSHSPYVTACGSVGSTCFASLSSSTIIQIDSCLGHGKDYTQLEEVFQLMSANFPDKYISLDVKAWTPCKLSNANLTKEMNLLAQKIIDLTVKYGLEYRVMVESETGDFLYYMKKHTGFVETYLATLGDFEMGASRAIDAGFTGISFKYKFKEAITKEHVDLLHRKGLKIQVWTVNDTNDIKEAQQLKVDFIQTDNVAFVLNARNPKEKEPSTH